MLHYSVALHVLVPENGARAQRRAAPRWLQRPSSRAYIWCVEPRVLLSYGDGDMLGVWLLVLTAVLAAPPLATAAGQAAP
eukprot:COSAG06_NODE_12158_length_1416_cov_1.246773_1_plen_79_part_10